MGRPTSDTAVPAAADRVPVTVLTGFLGAGKTTILNRLLQQPGMSDAAVIVNEFGEIGIDHLLVEKILGDAVLLDSGCLCCSVRGDLVDTMTVLRRRAEAGDTPRFGRLLVETTGLADPAPVLQTVMADPMLTGYYRLHALVAAVDAVNGFASLDDSAEAVKQAALASRLLVTKVDIAPEAAIATLEARLRALNPAAPLYRVANGEVDAGVLVGGRDDFGAADSDVSRWLPSAEPSDHGRDDSGHAHDHTHDDGIRSFCLTRERPVAWPALRTWLESLTSLRGADLLRVKGIVNIDGLETPVLLHGVQHIFYPPQAMDAWPDEDRRTRIVCITRGLAEADVSNALDAAIENLPN